MGGYDPYYPGKPIDGIGDEGDCAVHDAVISPSHYNLNGYEASDLADLFVKEAGVSAEEAPYAYQMFTYIIRSPYKGATEQDVKKAANCFHKAKTGRWLEKG